MRIVAVMPIKLQNERLPGKNIALLGERPLLQYELSSLKRIEIIDDIFVFCSNEEIKKYLLEGVKFLRRPKTLDLPTSNFTQIFSCFMQTVDADIYVYAHATAPFVKTKTMCQCIEAVVSGKYDSAFCASRLQDYLWKDGEPLNFDATDLPRSQDLPVLYRETSGIYVFTREVFQEMHRRVGKTPFIKEISFKEAVDINTQEDFALAQAMLGMDL